MAVRSQVLGFAAEVQDRATDSLGRISNSYGKLRHSAQRAAQMVSHSQGVISSFGEALGAIGLVSFAKRIVGYWENSIKATQEFELAQEELRYNLGKTKEEMKGLRDEVFRVGSTTLYTATEATKAWYELVSYGLSGTVRFKKGTQEMQAGIAEMALESTLNFSTMSQGQVDLAESARFAGALIAKTGIDLSKVNWDEQGRRVTLLDRAMDKLAKTAVLTGYHMKEFPDALNSMRTAMQGANVDLETALAITGVLKTSGMTAKEAGQAFNAMTRKLGDFSSRFLMDEFYSKIYAQMPAKRSKKGMGGPVGGTRELLRQSRMWYWIENIFGSKEGFRQALTDAKGNVGDFINFMAKIESGLEAKYGKGAVGGAAKMGLLQKFFGEQVARQSFQAIEKYRLTLEQDVYAVDEWGKAVEKNGKKTLLFNKDIEYTGFQALAALRASIKQSEGAAQKYKTMMEETSWGLKKMRDSAKETFMILIGEHVLPILNKFYLYVKKSFQSMSDFARAHPMITKVIVVIALLLTGILALTAAISVAVVAWGFMKVNLGHMVNGIRIAIASMLGLTKATAAATAAQTAYNVASKGAAFGIPRAPGWRGAAAVGEGATQAIAGPTIFSRIGALVARFGGIARILGVVGSITAVIWGVTKLWKENTWGIAEAVNGVGLGLRTKVMGPIQWLLDKFKWLYNVLRFIGVILGGSMWMEHDIWAGVGDETALSILSFFRDNKIGQTIDKIAMGIGHVMDFLEEIEKKFKVFSTGFIAMAGIGGGAGGLIGFLLFGPAGFVVGSLIGAAIGGIIAIIKNLYDNWDEISELWLEKVEKIKKSFSGIFPPWLVGAVKGLVFFLGGFFKLFISGWKLMGTIMEFIVLTIKAVVLALADVFNGLLKGFFGVEDNISKIRGGLGKKLPEDGWVGELNKLLDKLDVSLGKMFKDIVKGWGTLFSSLAAKMDYLRTLIYKFMAVLNPFDPSYALKYKSAMIDYVTAWKNLLPTKEYATERDRRAAEILSKSIPIFGGKEGKTVIFNINAAGSAMQRAEWEVMLNDFLRRYFDLTESNAQVVQ